MNLIDNMLLNWYYIVILFNGVFKLSTLGTYFLYYFVIISSGIISWSSEFFRKKNIKKIAKWLFFSSLIIPVMISGLRYGIGTDYHNYSDIYYSLTTQFYGIGDAIFNTRFEPSWVILNFLVYYIFDDVVFMFITSSFLIWLFSFKSIYDNKDRINIGIAVLILLCTLYSFSFNGVRQALAIAALMLSIKPLLEKKLWKFLLIVAFASTFHFTALIFAPVYWIANSRTENRRLLKNALVPTLFIGFVFLIDPILSFVSNIELFSFYSNYEVEYKGIAIRELVLKSPIVILILINFKKLKLDNNLMYKISILFIIGIILFLLRGFGPHISRVALYFDFTQIFIVSAIVKSQKGKNESLLYSYLIIIYYLAYFTYHFIYLGRHGTIPYSWIL